MHYRQRRARRQGSAVEVGGAVSVGLARKEHPPSPATLHDAGVEQLRAAGEASATLGEVEDDGSGQAGRVRLGLGALRGIDAICLMGVTSGYLVDPKAAQEVLRILSRILGIEVGMQALEERAKEMEKIIGKLQEMERAQAPYEAGGDEDLRYIG